MSKTSEKIEWRKEVIVILNRLLSDNKINDAMQHCGVTHEFFDDSCKYSALYHGVFTLVDIMKTLNYYDSLYLESES